MFRRHTSRKSGLWSTQLDGGNVRSLGNIYTSKPRTPDTCEWKQTKKGKLVFVPDIHIKLKPWYTRLCSRRSKFAREKLKNVALTNRILGGTGKSTHLWYLNLRARRYSMSTTATYISVCLD